MNTPDSTSHPVNRRRHERFATMPMYTAIVAECQDAPGEPLDGHAYDISEAGIRFELDRAISPGSAVTLRIELPRWLPAPIEAVTDHTQRDPGGPDAPSMLIEPKPIEVLANVIWIDDDGVPGPVRMAATFTAFLDAADRDRLFDTLAAGALRRAA